MKLWQDAIPDPLKTVIPTNEALTIKEWIELIVSEHNYHLYSAATAPDSPVKSPAKSICADDSISAQIEFCMTNLTDTDEDNTTEVVIYQCNSQDSTNTKLELQELSDFDPYKLTSIEIPRTDLPSSSTNSFSVQVSVYK